MFKKSAQLLCRYPWLCISLWMGTAILTGLIAPDEQRLRSSEPLSLLPPDSPLNEAMRDHELAFPDQAARSKIVLVFQRPSGLTSTDRRFMESLAEQIEADGGGDQRRWRVWAGGTDPASGLRLNSEDGRASMIIVNLAVNFLTQRAMAAVERVQRIAGSSLPPGLTMEITGSAGIGKEHNARSQAALERTTWVTITAVLIILALVYRSPLGALVPLFSIGLSVFIAFRLLDFLALSGWAISGAERMFTVVLLFGAGTNYALFWISRYREELSRGSDLVEAVVEAMARVGPAILASAGTTILGLSMLIAADMVIIHNSGKVLGMMLCIALLAAITLIPCLTLVMGRAFFWPGTAAERYSVGQKYIWPQIAASVVRRPAAVLFCGLLLLSIPTLKSMSIVWKYDSFGEVPEGSSAQRGLQLVRDHFSEAELFSTRILISSAEFASDPQRAKSASEDLAARIAALEGVSDVWHMAEPLGSRRQAIPAAILNTFIVQDKISNFYFSKEQNILQLEVMQHFEPFETQAVELYHLMLSTARDWAEEELEIGYDIHAIGQTPYIDDVETVANRDLSKVIGLVILVIWIVVMVLIRRLRLTIFMLAATLITYAAALGITSWLFVDALGGGAIDYKIRILLFVIIVAVGQDYNIFLIARMLEEIKTYELKEAITRSIILTGPIITSCGLIMAATLGSLSTSGVELTEQLGFACAVGILLDTFLVRPLLIPSFYLLLERGRCDRKTEAGKNSPLIAPAGPR